VKAWLDSDAIRYLFFTWLASFIAQLASMLENPPVNWRTLGIQALIALGGVLLRMSKPDVVAPIAALNRQNPKG